MAQRCFVVIGFGVKTDLATGRKIDLDRTYRELIKPSLDPAGVDCYRAIDLNLAGSIDELMYHELLDADIVVADLSTLNANVLYELGVRHALKPRTTVLIAESELLRSIPFDLSHTVIHKYTLTGEDLPEDEAERFRQNLTRTILGLRDVEDPSDSPVYEHLHGLEQPHLHGEGPLPKREEREGKGSLAVLLNLAAFARGRGDHAQAVTHLEEALRVEHEAHPSPVSDLQPDDLSIRHQLISALLGQAAEGESGSSSALGRAQELITAARPESSTDPQTLALAGEIEKELYQRSRDLEHLKRAAWHYARAFHIKQDHDLGREAARLQVSLARNEKSFFRRRAWWLASILIWETVAERCRSLTVAPNFSARTDRRAVYETLAESQFALGNMSEAKALAPLLAASPGPAFNWASFSDQHRELVRQARVNRLWTTPAYGWVLPLPALLVILALGVGTAGLLRWSNSNGNIRTLETVAERLETVSNNIGRAPKDAVPDSPSQINTPPGARVEGADKISTEIRVIREQIDTIRQTLTSVDRPRLNDQLKVINDRLESIQRLGSVDLRPVHTEFRQLNDRLVVLNSINDAVSRIGPCSQLSTRVTNLSVEVTNLSRVIAGLPPPARAQTKRATDGPYIQFENLRPGLEKGFRYALSGEQTIVEELDLQLRHAGLAKSKSLVPGFAVSTYARPRRELLAATTLEKDREVRFQQGPYCSILALRYDPESAMWQAQIRRVEGCQECDAACGSARVARLPAQTP